MLDFWQIVCECIHDAVTSKLTSVWSDGTFGHPCL